MFTLSESGISIVLAVLWFFASASQSAAQRQTVTDLGTTFTTLHSFDGTDGHLAFAGLVQATNGNLYGTTYYGGAEDSGEVFEITPGGTLTTLYSLCSRSDCTDGEYTYATPVQDTDGNFYGTTYLGHPGRSINLTPTLKIVISRGSRRVEAPLGCEDCGIFALPFADCTRSYSSHVGLSSSSARGDVKLLV